MEETLEHARQVIELGGWMAPLFFICLHIVRQVLFLPVLLVCLLGGYLFGTMYGSFYSIIGLTGASLVFYYLIALFPRLKEKLTIVKKRYHLTIPQMMIMRLLPFVHFHLISLYLIETEKNKKNYLKKSLVVSIPPAVVYTAFGDMIHELRFWGAVALISCLTVLFLFFRPNKEATIHWDDFFIEQKK